jgi:hypothetical protein
MPFGRRRGRRREKEVVVSVRVKEKKNTKKESSSRKEAGESGYVRKSKLCEQKRSESNRVE